MQLVVRYCHSCAVPFVEVTINGPSQAIVSAEFTRADSLVESSKVSKLSSQSAAVTIILFKVFDSSCHKRIVALESDVKNASSISFGRNQAGPARCIVKRDIVVVTHVYNSQDFS